VLVESQQGPNPLFSALELKLDEKGTDLNSEDRVQLKLDATAAVYRTRWNTPASISLSVSGGADKVSQIANVGFAGTLKTDTVALAKFLAKTSEADYCSPRRPDPYDKEGKYNAYACAELKKLQSVTHVRGVVETIANINRASIQYQREKLSQLDTLYKQAEPRKADSYKWQIKAAQSELENEERFDRELTRGLKQNTSELTFDLNVESLALEGWGELRDLTFKLDANSVSVSLKFVSTKIKDIEGYFSFKPLAEQYLLAIQNGDPKATQEVKELAKLYLGLVTNLFSPDAK